MDKFYKCSFILHIEVSGSVTQCVKKNKEEINQYASFSYYLLC